MGAAALSFLILGMSIGSPFVAAAPPQVGESESSRMNRSGELLPYGAIAKVNIARIRGNLSELAISPDGKWLAGQEGEPDWAKYEPECEGNARVAVLDLRTGRRTASIEIPGCTEISQLQFRTDSKELAVVGYRVEKNEGGISPHYYSIKVIDVGKQGIVGGLPEAKLQGYGLRIAHFEAEKGMLIETFEMKQTGLGREEETESNDPNPMIEQPLEEPKPERHQFSPLLVWNPRTDKLNELYDKEEEFFVASEGRVLSLLGQKIRLINPVTKQVFAEWTRPNRAVWPIGVSPDGKRLVAWKPVRERVADSRFIDRSDQLVVCETGKTPQVIEKFKHWTEARVIRTSSGLLFGAVTIRQEGNLVSEPPYTLRELLTGSIASEYFRKDWPRYSSPDNRIFAFGDKTITLVEMATSKEIGTIPNAQGGIRVLAFSADSQTLTTVGEDSSVMIWDWAKTCQSSTEQHQHQSIEKAWAQLNDPDPNPAYAGMLTLKAAPRETVEFLNRRLKIDPKLEQERIQQWIGQLDHDRFAVRERAKRELWNRSRTVQPTLEKLLKDALPSETEKRIQSILESMAQGRLSPQELRQLRAIQILEWINTTDSRALLEELAKGNSLGIQASEARAALARQQGLARLRE